MVDCKHTAKTRTKRHNSIFLLLHKILRNTNGGRWPIIGLDLGSTPITYFSKHNTDIEETTSSHLQPIPDLEQEGLQDDKPNTMEPKYIIAKYIFPAHNRPTHQRPDLIRAVGYTFGPIGKLSSEPTYQGRREPQLIECKCSTDENIPEIINHIHTIYEPLKQALQHHGTLKADIKIISIVISRTITFNVKTLAEIAQLVSFKEEPPDTLTYKQLARPAKKMYMAFHVHAQELLSHISKILRKILTTNRRPNTKQQALRLEHSQYENTTDFGGGRWRRWIGASGYSLHRAGRT